MKLNIPRQQLHRYAFLFGLAFLVSCLPLSKYLLSIAQFFLIANWLIEGNFRQKLHNFLQKPALLLFASLFLVYAFSLLYSQNLEAGFVKVKNVLPVLVLALIFGTSEPLSKVHTKWLLTLFSVAVSVASLVCITRYLTDAGQFQNNFRKISVFMNHVVFSMMINMAISVFLYFTFYNRYPVNRIWKPAYISAATALTAFLFFLGSVTGMVTFFFVALAFALNITRAKASVPLRNAIYTLSAIVLIIPVVWLFHTYQKNFNAEPPDPAHLEMFTPGGHPYTHDLSTGIQDNGHFSGIYICEPELQRQWNRISKIPYDQLDGRGQAIFGTVKRYLTSLGLRKDSIGLGMLTPYDIQKIEKGLANFKFESKPGIRQRIYETLWEIQVFLKSGYMQRHSLGQRFAFYKTAASVIRNHMLFGVGIGDMQDTMLEEARKTALYVDPRWEGQPHNQYLSFLLAFGIVGFVWIFYSWIHASLFSGAFRNLLFNMFWLIMLITMLVGDPIHSYFSVMFFSFFGCLFFADGYEKKPADQD
ncbi:MAG: O-antigen ligase family protein [Bacteroidales bacterium]|nr:O-antigen ligase family protein [Bacteroidales bacterium]